MSEQLRIVVACGADGPPELQRDVLTLGAELADRGHLVDYIVGDPVGLASYAGGYVPGDVFQAPLLRAAPDLVMKRQQPDGLLDQMAVAGFADRDILTALSDAWKCQLSLMRPNIILAFNVPVLWLIGPTVAPTVALGPRAILPPTLGSSFPRLSHNSAPLAAEELMLNYANGVLAKVGHNSLATIAEVLDRCSPIVYGLPCFDPYLQLRKTQPLGLLGERAEPAYVPVKPRLAAFLDVYCPGVETAVLALAGFDDVAVDVTISGATPGMRRFLEQQPHVRFWGSREELRAQIGSVSAVIHHGAQDVAETCVLTGRPQLVLPWLPEQHLLVEVFRWMGSAVSHAPNSPIQEMDVAFRSLLHNGGMVIAAQHHARQMAEVRFQNALPQIVQLIERRANQLEKSEKSATGPAAVLPLHAGDERADQSSSGLDGIGGRRVG